ncbi:glycosyltransferase family 4 protein [Caldisericum sp.]|jgi:glycosyltransferase involved in cell wall biosynthesis|uniref:glycosyltransferase family 4 protein n=1 Tax=Caldisericum sp. TaxID=2499687 RepID=UPI003D137CFF
MRILFLAKNLDAGGVTTQAFFLGRMFVKEGHKVAIASGSFIGQHSFNFVKFKEAGFTVYEIPFPGQDNMNLINAIKSFLRFYHILKDYQPDIIHIHWRATSIYALFAKKFFKIPVVSTLHLQNIPHSWIYRVFSFWGDYAIAISTETFEELIKVYKVPKERVVLIYNGVDDDYFRPPTESEKKQALSKYGLSESDQVISLIGRLTFVKGQDILLKALKILKDKSVNLTAILAGAGDSESIIKLAKELGVENNIILPGFVDSREVLWASDILVLPSRQEGFAVVIAEAMLCGVVPIRTPAAGAYDQIDDGINGFLVPFENPIVLAEKIELLLRDRNLKNKMSLAAIQKARDKFVLRESARKTMEIYEMAIKDYGQRNLK